MPNSAILLQGWTIGASSNQALEFPSLAWTNRLALPLDAEITEQFTKTNEMTSSPVETGAVISDHIVRKPDRLVIEAAISNTPVTLKAISGFSARGSNPIKDAYAFLDNLVEARQLFDFVGIMQVYKSYAAVSWAPMQNAKLGTILQFTMTMQRMILVSSVLVPAALLAPNKKLTGGTKSSLGTQQVQPATLSLNAAAGAFQGVEPTAQVTLPVSAQ